MKWRGVSFCVTNHCFRSSVACFWFPSHHFRKNQTRAWFWALHTLIPMQMQKVSSEVFFHRPIWWFCWSECINACFI